MDGVSFSLSIFARLSPDATAGLPRPTAIDDSAAYEPIHKGIDEEIDDG